MDTFLAGGQRVTGACVCMRAQMIRLGKSGYTMTMNSVMRTAHMLAKELLATGTCLLDIALLHGTYLRRPNCTACRCWPEEPGCSMMPPCPSSRDDLCMRPIDLRS